MATREVREAQPELYRCTSPFSVFRGGIPVVYGAGEEVLGTDPILRTHMHHFEPASSQVLKRATAPRYEQATRAPGEVRAPVLPSRPITDRTTTEEPPNG